MDYKRRLDDKFETIAWGLLFIWWGLRWWILIMLPDGSGLVGTGLILLGLNLARSLIGIPTRSFTTLLGLLALGGGGLMVVNETMHLPFQLPVFETILIVIGLVLLGRGLMQVRRAGMEPEA
jgi:hypothetical protein